MKDKVISLQNGVLITFEGGEGAGKTSVIREMGARLKKLGYDVMATREPGGVLIAEQIRRVILDENHTAMDARTEALLYAAARREHLVEKIIPALNKGKIVLCDRFIDSSLAYQGYARGIGMEEVLKINEFAVGSYFPDLTLFLDVEPKVGLERITKDLGREINRLDKENIAFHNKVREGFLSVYERFPKRIKRIDANQPFADVVEASFQVIQRFLASEN